MWGTKKAGFQMLQVNPENMRCTTAALFSLLLVLSSLGTFAAQDETFLRDVEAEISVDAANESATLAYGWATSAGGAMDDFISQSATYSNGTFIVVGSYEGDIQFRDQIDGHGATGGSSDRDAMIGWINPNGTWNASLAFGTNGIDSVEAVSLLPGGDVILAGNFCLNSAGFQCQLQFGDLAPLTKNDEDDDGNVFLARLDAGGTWLWSTQLGNEYDNFVFDMMITTTNEIHLGVLFRDSIEFQGDILPAAEQGSVITAVYNEGGQPLSYVSLDTQEGIEPVGGLCEDGAGQTYISATFRGEVLVGETLLVSEGETDMMVASYQGNEWMWAISAGGPLEERAWGCSGSPNQGISVVGEFAGNATFGVHSTTTSQNVDMVLALVSSSGIWNSIATAGGTGTDRATGVVTNAQGDITITGTTSAGIEIGEDLLPDLDGVNDDMHNDIFLATYLQNGTWAWAVSAGGDGNDEPTDLTFALDGSPLLTFMLSGTASIGIHNATSYGGYDVGVWLYQTDRDGDGILDGEDNCPRSANTQQGNHDSDLFGDECDNDDDDDGVEDDLDDCPTGALNWVSNSNTDHDGDGCEDNGEDFDDDEDTVFDFNDLCPLGPVGWISTPEDDTEGDGCADYDTDEDGFIDQMDNCPSVANPTQGDLDEDGLGDACDVDEDGDGIAAPADNCPRDTTAWASNPINDYDQDGCHDSINDDDDDGDGFLDADDACPSGDFNWNSEEVSIQLDHDQDGCQDSTEDDDDDNDGVSDSFDACPKGMVGAAVPGQDEDQDGCLDATEDEDDDNDGVLDIIDACPQTEAGAQVGIQGCSMSQLDDDLDGVSNADDMCLNSLPVQVDETGCAVLGQNDDAASENNEDGNLAQWLLMVAVVLLLAAGFVTYTGKPQSKTAQNITPPKRPVGLDDAVSISVEHAEQE